MWRKRRCLRKSQKQQVRMLFHFGKIWIIFWYVKELMSYRQTKLSIKKFSKKLLQTCYSNALKKVKCVQWQKVKNEQIYNAIRPCSFRTNSVELKGRLMRELLSNGCMAKFVCNFHSIHYFLAFETTSKETYIWKKYYWASLMQWINRLLS